MTFHIYIEILRMLITLFFLEICFAENVTLLQETTVRQDCEYTRTYFFINPIMLLKNAWLQKSLRIFKKNWNNPTIRPDVTENRDELENSREIFNAENRTETSEVKDISRKSFQKKMKTYLIFYKWILYPFSLYPFSKFSFETLEEWIIQKKRLCRSWPVTTQDLYL